MARRPSNPSEKTSSDPPPPPPLLLELLGRGVGGGGGVEPPGVGVGPDVMAAMQAVLPALAGAEVVALVAPMVTSALSNRPSSSVTVSWSVMDPELGATTVAEAVFAPTITGGFAVG